ncbi:MAG: glycosyltransferase family 4 protein [Candidatus Kuenenia stuttgartiensis]|nr:glycosyltransferase family 4 protein [Candidatus Kuenenia stuttgartiensis]
MKLLILNENYPHANNLLGDVFVHVRATEYIKHHQVKVCAFPHPPQTLNYEGVEIEMCDDVKAVSSAIQEFQPDRIFIHFYSSWMLDVVLKKFEIPINIWVHGFEALGWYRRLFNYKWYSPYIYRYILKNTIQQYGFRKMIQYANRTDKVCFIFVSNWMKRITEYDTMIKIRNAHIIPNPIAVDKFSYSEKNAGYRKKILILRSFSSHKYANDISVKAIQYLSQKPWFFELSFTIIGDGALFDKILNPIKHLPNVKIQRGIISNKEIPAIHAKHGVFLCPTRQDAQGVSMCEAMSSGLVPISSHNTAIPEYVTHLENGFLTHSYQDIADAIEQLFYNPELFSKMSYYASKSIKDKCDIINITEKELNIKNK